MRVGLGTHGLAVALICVLVPLGAGAAQILYAWTGFVEPGSVPGNPWGLAGDGSALTHGDGTPFTLEVLVEQLAPDLDGSMNAGSARFAPVSVSLVIGGSAAGVGTVGFFFGDDDPNFQFDSIVFQTPVTLLGTTLGFGAEVRLPVDTFALATPAAPDPAPLFATTSPIQFGGFGGDVLTAPADAPVTATLVPEPASAALVGMGLCALAARRRRAARG